MPNVKMGLRLGWMLIAPALLASSCARAADDPVTIASVVPYESPPSSEDARVRACPWNSELSASIVAGSGAGVVATAQDLGTVHGRTLQLVITAARFSAMGGSSATVRGELYADGKGINGFSFHRVNAVYGRDDCYGLSRISRSLAGSIVKWLRNPMTNSVASPAGPGESQ